jgi:hypothetical protein
MASGYCKKIFLIFTEKHNTAASFSISTPDIGSGAHNQQKNNQAKFKIERSLS